MRLIIIFSMRMLIRVMLCFWFIGSHVVLQAHKLEVRPDPWHRHVTLGGVLNTGNSQTRQLHGQAKIDYECIDWDNYGLISGQWGRDQVQSTAQQILAELELRYRFLPNYMFFKGRSLFDRFSVYDRLWQLSSGLGRMLLDDGAHRFKLELGPGSRHRRVSGSRDMQHEFIAGALLHYKWTLSETAVFSQHISLDAGRFNTTTESRSALKVRIAHQFALELSYAVSHHARLPAESKNRAKTDTKTQIAVVYDF